MKTKYLSLLLLLLAGVTLVGCGKNSENTKTAPPAANWNHTNSNSMPTNSVSTNNATGTMS